MFHVWLKSLSVAVAALALWTGAALTPPRPVPSAGVPAAARPAKPPAYGNAYEPLRPGTRLTYVTTEGERFAREVARPASVTWFDGTLRQVIPVWDDRFQGYFLYQQEAGEVRVIGGWRGQHLETWGEYVPIIGPAAAGESVTQISTPAGEFAHVRQVDQAGAPAWYAEGIGLVKTDTFTLLRCEQVKPLDSGLSPLPSPVAYGRPGV